jgi:hypothetical protein
MRIILLSALILVSGLSFAQSQDELKELAMNDAMQLTQSYLNENVAKLIQYTHPQVIASLGGKEVVAKSLKATFDNAKKSKVITEKNKIGKLLDFKQENGEYRCLIEKLTVYQNTSEKKRIIQNNTMFGFYNKTTKKWTFVDGNKLIKGNAKNYFKDFKTAIKIPDIKMETVEIK